MTLIAPCPKCGVGHVAELGIDNWLIVRCPVCGRQPRPPLKPGEEPVPVKDTLIAWKSRAMVEMSRLARSGVEFSADDITGAIGMPPEANMMGALFVSCHKTGLIRPVGTRQGENPQRHGGSQRIWVGARR